MVYFIFLGAFNPGHLQCMCVPYIFNQIKSGTLHQKDFVLTDLAPSVVYHGTFVLANFTFLFCLIGSPYVYTFTQRVGGIFKSPCLFVCHLLHVNFIRMLLISTGKIDFFII